MALLQKELSIDVSFVFHNTPLIVQKNFREHLRNFFALKNKSQHKLKREAVVILNQENIPLNRMLMINRRPNYAVVHLNPILKKEISEDSDPDFNQFIDLKIVQKCVRYGYTQNTSFVLLADVSHCLEVFFESKTPCEVTIKTPDGLKESFMLDSKENLSEAQMNVDYVLSIKIRNIFFDQVINLGARNIVLEPSYQRVVKYFWSEVETGLERNLKGLSKDYEELLGLKKCLIVLPNVISDILVEKLQAENISNISCFENYDAYASRQEENVTLHMIEYLERTNYRELGLYLESTDQIEIYEKIMGEKVFDYLEEYRTNAATFIPALNRTHQQNIASLLPQSYLNDVFKQNIPAGAFVNTFNNKRKTIQQFCNVVKLDKEQDNHFGLLSAQLKEKLIAEYRPMLLMYNLDALDMKTIKRISVMLAEDIPSKEELNSFSIQSWESFLMEFTNKKEHLNDIIKGNPGIFSAWAPQWKDMMVKFIADFPTMFYTHADRTLSNELVNEISTKLPNLGLSNSKFQRQPEYITRLVKELFEYIQLHFPYFLDTLIETKSTTAATYLFYYLSELEKSNFFDQVLEKTIVAEEQKDQRIKLLQEYFNQNGSGLIIKDMILRHTHFLTGTYDMLICLSSESSKIRELKELKNIPIVEISKEIEDEYLAILSKEKINLKNKDELIKYVIRVTNERLEEMKQRSTVADAIERYILESVVLLLKLFFCMLYNKLSPEVLDKIDQRAGLKVKFKKEFELKIKTLRQHVDTGKEKVTYMVGQKVRLDKEHDKLVKSSIDVDKQIDQKRKELEDRVSQSTVQYNKLSNIVKSQKNFSKTFANSLNSFIFSDMPVSKDEGSKKIFNYSEQHLLKLETDKIYIVTLSSKLKGFVEFCIKNDQISPHLIPIGVPNKIPADTTYIALDANLDKEVVDYVQEKFTTAHIFEVNTKDQGVALDNDEREKRKHRDIYLANRNAASTFKNKLTSLTSKAHQIDGFFDKIEVVIENHKGNTENRMESVKKLLGEKIDVETEYKVILEKIERIDGKFNQTIEKVRDSISITADGNAPGLETIEKLSAELVSIYGEYDSLLLIKKFSRFTTKLIGLIKDKILDSLSKRNKIRTPMSQIPNIMIIHDQSNTTIEYLKLVNSIIPILIDIHPKKVFNNKFQGLNTQLYGLEKNSVLMLILDKFSTNSEILLTFIYAINKKLSKQNIVVFTSYPEINLESGDSLKNELAMGINNLSNNSILINTRDIGDETHPWFLSVLYRLFDIK